MQLTIRSYIQSYFRLDLKAINRNNTKSYDLRKYIKSYVSFKFTFFKLELFKITRHDSEPKLEHQRRVHKENKICHVYAFTLICYKTKKVLIFNLKKNKT